MERIVKYGEYEVNEGVRDLMTPKSPQDAIKNILEHPHGYRWSDAVNALEQMKEGGLLEVMTEDDRKRIAEMAKSDRITTKDRSSGQHKNIVCFMNRYGGGQWFINIEDGTFF